MKRNAYALSSALVTLSTLLKEDPHAGCRSGKDRTTMLDVEVTTRFTLSRLLGYFPDYLEMETLPLAMDVRERVALESGLIDDFVRANTGSRGLNLAGSYGGDLAYFGNRPTGKSSARSVLGGVYHAFARTIKFLESREADSKERGES